jgi:hypothetical protein
MFAKLSALRTMATTFVGLDQFNMTKETSALPVMLVEKSGSFMASMHFLDA